MTKHWTEEDVLGIARAFQPACVLVAGAELGIFDALAGGPSTSEALAAGVGTDIRATTMLLVLQRYEGSRKLRRRADSAFQEHDSWKETEHGRQHGSEDQTRFDAVLARV